MKGNDIWFNRPCAVEVSQRAGRGIISQQCRYRNQFIIIIFANTHKVFYRSLLQLKIIQQSWADKNHPSGHGCRSYLSFTNKRKISKIAVIYSVQLVVYWTKKNTWGCVVVEKQERVVSVLNLTVP